jgi:hypothetical protein
VERREGRSRRSPDLSLRLIRVSLEGRLSAKADTPEKAATASMTTKYAVNPLILFTMPPGLS